MKIALPTKADNTIDNHFGHCQFYTLLTISDDKKISKTEILPSPEGCGCKSNIATQLREKGVSIMLAGNMGEGALNVLHNNGIVVVRGCKGNVNEVAQAYLNGALEDSGLVCHEEDEHHCSSHTFILPTDIKID